MRAVFVLGKTCSYKWYSSRLIFSRMNGPVAIVGLSLLKLDIEEDEIRKALLIKQETE